MRLSAAVLVAMLEAVLPSSAVETPPHSIAVMGEAEIALPPDYALVEVGVITQGATVSEVLAENNARMTKVIEAVRALGIADKDIQTSKFDVLPRYRKHETGNYYNDDFEPIVDYSVSNRAIVTVDDPSRIAKVIDASIPAGANASGRVESHVRDRTARFDLAPGGDRERAS